MKLSLASIVAIMLISACSALGLATPKGFDQQLAEAYSTHTAVVQATTAALGSGAINSTEATQVQVQANSARALLDAAKAAESANAPEANSDLSLALVALTALQTFLNNQGKH